MINEPMPAQPAKRLTRQPLGAIRLYEKGERVTHETNRKILGRK
jgi:hypothetical protein